MQFVRILFTAQSALAAVVHVSLIYYMHMDIVEDLHFMETNFSWKHPGKEKVLEPLKLTVLETAL